MPVRLVAFAHVAHLEVQMGRFIDRKTRGDEWLQLLDDGGARTLGMAKKLARDRLDPNLLDLTLFSEKRQAVARLLGLKPAEEEELKKIQQIRNAVAHGNEFGGTNEELDAFVKGILTIGSWIRRLDALRDHEALATTGQPPY
jgi:hypothetical protein